MGKYSCTWIGRINIFKISVFSAVLSKCQFELFTEPEKLILKLMWNYRGHTIAKGFLNKKNQAGGIIIPDSKAFYKAVMIKMAWYWHKNGNIDQLKRIERRN